MYHNASNSNFNDIISYYLSCTLVPQSSPTRNHSDTSISLQGVLFVSCSIYITHGLGGGSRFLSVVLQDICIFRSCQFQSQKFLASVHGHVIYGLFPTKREFIIPNINVARSPVKKNGPALTNISLCDGENNGH